MTLEEKLWFAMMEQEHKHVLGAARMITIGGFSMTMSKGREYTSGSGIFHSALASDGGTSIARPIQSVPISGVAGTGNTLIAAETNVFAVGDLVTLANLTGGNGLTNQAYTVLMVVDMGGASGVGCYLQLGIASTVQTYTTDITEGELRSFGHILPSVIASEF